MKDQEYNTACRKIIQGVFDSFEKDCESILY